MQLPPVVILQLKRFRFACGTVPKVYQHVSFPIKGLDLGQLTTGLHLDAHQKYDLHGVAEHYGSHRSGHYTALCLNQPTTSWLHFDDTIVKETTAAKVENASAYVPFYAAEARQEGLPAGPVDPWPRPVVKSLKLLTGLSLKML